ncbi:RES family NAD+ phosphorylase [Ensifer soli]|uniref:RES family NAD+ phosphorylase n=1 Tax=Ciceribacter sp. sgz301302 TaxID=3342379 RepID=UPI0035BB62F2
MIPERDFTDPATVRLISTAYLPEPAIAPLAETEAELAILTALEEKTSARGGPAVLPAGVDPAELLPPSYGYGHTLVNAAFCHARPPGNRFNDAERGAWYCAFGPDAGETSQAEIVFHRTRALKEAGCLTDRGAYRELLAGFTCRFHDLTGLPGHPSLEADTRSAYPAGQALARAIRAGGGNGLIYPSARRPGGRCIAVFRPSVIQNVRQGRQVTFEWTGAETPRIVVAA